MEFVRPAVEKVEDKIDEGVEPVGECKEQEIEVEDLLFSVRELVES